MAYLTTTILEQESTWFFTAWQPQIASSGAFDTWIGTLVTRVGNHTAWRAGAANYAGTGDPSVSTAVAQAVLQEAELCLAQYYLCLASAAIADTSDDVTTVPAIAHGSNLRADAVSYLARYDRIMAAFDGGAGRSDFALGVAVSSGSLGGPGVFPEIIPALLSTVDWARPG